MIVSRDVNPERDVYYLGSVLIEIISSIPNSEIGFFELFELLNLNLKTSFNLFILTLDWLFLIGVIGYKEKGILKKCF